MSGRSFPGRLVHLFPMRRAGSRRRGGGISLPFCRRLPRSLEGVSAAGPYDGLLRRVVLQMKHRWNAPLSRAIAHLFAHRLHQKLAPWAPTLVVPVPMHWRRRWVRGVNSPEILARALGRDLGVSVADRLAIPRRCPRLQVELSPTARKSNVQGAFRVHANARLQDARVLLVDDVLTSGATCGELAKVLKQAGASAVWAAVLARTPPRTSR
jgi:ComF family protein